MVSAGLETWVRYGVKDVNVNVKKRYAGQGSRPTVVF
jgi:hypothetical protein